MSYPIRNNKLIQEAYEAGRQSVYNFNEQQTFTGMGMPKTASTKGSRLQRGKSMPPRRPAPPRPGQQVSQGGKRRPNLGNQGGPPPGGRPGGRGNQEWEAQWLLDGIIQHWGQTVPPAPPWCDLNGDGIINVDDLLWLLANNGATA